MMDDQVISIAAGIAVPIVVCLVASIVSLVSASNIPGGWLKRTLMMIDIYERAPMGTTVASDEIIALLALRNEIYSNIVDGLGYKFEKSTEGDLTILDKKFKIRRYLRLFAIDSLIAMAAFAISLFISGVDMGHEALLTIAVFGLACSAASIGASLAIVSVLRRWPQSQRNPFYMRKTNLIKLQKSIAAKAKTLDEIERNPAFEKAIEASLGRKNRNDSIAF